MDEKLIDREIENLMVAIENCQYGDERMNMLQKQLHSLIDLKNKLPKKRKASDWFWENSKGLLSIGSGVIMTLMVINAEHIGPVLSKAFGFLPKPRI